MIADSPIAEPIEADTEASELYFVLVKHYSRWVLHCDDEGDQAVFPTLAEAEAGLVEAKRWIARKSKDGKLAAAGLRIAHSPTEEI